MPLNECYKRIPLRTALVILITFSFVATQEVLALKLPSFFSLITDTPVAQAIYAQNAYSNNKDNTISSTNSPADEQLLRSGLYITGLLTPFVTGNTTMTTIDRFEANRLTDLSLTEADDLIQISANESGAGPFMFNNSFLCPGGYQFSITTPSEGDHFTNNTGPWVLVRVVAQAFSCSDVRTYIILHVWGAGSWTNWNPYFPMEPPPFFDRVIYLRDDCGQSYALEMTATFIGGEDSEVLAEISDSVTITTGNLLSASSCMAVRQ
jgi:hypothetical protein